MTEEDLFATEDHDAVRVTSEGTHRGTLQGVAPTGQKIRISGNHTYRFEDGKTAETWQLWDVAAFLRQIGALDLYVC
jgi:predicted ester cyclase